MKIFANLGFYSQWKYSSKIKVCFQTNQIKVICQVICRRPTFQTKYNFFQKRQYSKEKNLIRRKIIRQKNKYSERAYLFVNKNECQLYQTIIGMFHRAYTQQSCTTAKKVYVKQKMHMTIQKTGGSNWYLSFNNLRYIWYN